MKIKVSCECCGKIKEVYPFRIKQNKVFFCNKICGGKWRSKNLIGKKAFNWKGGNVKRICEICKTTFEVEKHIVKGGKGMVCSPDCQKIWQSINIRGEKHPLWKEKVEVNCGWCNKILKVHSCRLKRSEKVFCPNSKCKHKWMSKNFRGKNNSAWLGGKSFETYGLEFNDKLKETIRIRDNYRCQECFRHQDELFTKSGRKYKLHIHHIDYNKQNNISENLISLCRNCHTQTSFSRKDWNKYFSEFIVKVEKAK